MTREEQGQQFTFERFFFLSWERKMDMSDLREGAKQHFASLDGKKFFSLCIVFKNQPLGAIISGREAFLILKNQFGSSLPAGILSNWSTRLKLGVQMQYRDLECAFWKGFEFSTTLHPLTDQKVIFLIFSSRFNSLIAIPIMFKSI